MAETELQPTRTAVDLNGDWERYVHGKLVDVVTVPSSLASLGLVSAAPQFFASCVCANGKRAIVHFDAINYHGRVFVNGTSWARPFLICRTNSISPDRRPEGRNTVEVQIADALPEPDGTGKDEIEYTSPGGWEPYGGIIRDVYVDVRPAAFIDNVRFGYQLSSDLESASCTSQVFISSTRSGFCRSANCHLWWRHTQVATGTATVHLKPGITEAEIKFDAKSLVLVVAGRTEPLSLEGAGQNIPAEDRWQCRTGFREIKTQGRLFMLNGKRLIMNGVCRHDTWKDQGFTLSRRQQEQDMRMIKAMGCNFVRLVHYPHDRRIVELAEELGLIVSEEPGFWNMDFDKMPKAQIDLGCSILEHTIRRDWNSPAVCVWLLGNECAFPGQLSEARQGDLRQAGSNSPPGFGCPYLWQVSRSQESIRRGRTRFLRLARLRIRRRISSPIWRIFRPRASRLPLPNGAGRSPAAEAVFYERDFDGLAGIGGRGKSLRPYVLELERYSPIHPQGLGDVQRHPVFRRGDREPGTFASQFTRGWRPCSTEGGRCPMHRSLARPCCPCARFRSRRAARLKPPTCKRWSILTSGKKSWSALEAALEKFWAGSVAEEQWKRTGSKFTLWPGQDIKIAGVSFSAPVVGEQGPSGAAD